jgi:hypothetical protein
MTEQEQVDALWGFQGGHDIEDELAGLAATRINAYQGGGVHTADVYEVVLENGRLAYFKPANGLLSPIGQRALRNYGQTVVSVTVAECAAWQVAKVLGGPWSDLVAPTAIRFLSLPNGSRDVGALTVYRPGVERRRGFLDLVPEQAAAGAFFDALIGQQDRNDGNILWYENGGRMYLIDHGFSFATAGASSGEVALTAWRARQGMRDLNAPEIRGLETLQEGHLADLAGFIAPERMETLRARMEAMLDTHKMPLVGAF